MIRYETIGQPFPSQFSGTCRLDYTHKIRRGELVSKIRRADNPYLPVTGVACPKCCRLLSPALEDD